MPGPAGLYSAGQSVWRVPVGHFSRWDFNWGFGPPANAAPPAPPGAPQDGSGAGPGACQQTGSIIDCQDPILRERLALAGTPFSLSYSSNRQLGRGAGLQIPLIGATVGSGPRKGLADRHSAGLALLQRVDPHAASIFAAAGGA